MMYDWLYSFHRCLIWSCLHWGIAHPSVMDFVRWWFMPDTFFSDIILHWGFTHFERMHSYWGRATLLILTLRLHLLFMIAALMDRRVVDTLGSNFSTYLVRLRYPFFLCYTLIYPTFSTIIPASILSKSHIFWAHIFHHPTWFYPFLLIRRRCRLVLSFLVEFSHAFGH